MCSQVCPVAARGFDLSSAKDAASLVIGLQPRDPQTFILAVIVLSEVTVLVSCLPGISRLDARPHDSHPLRVVSRTNNFT